MIATDLQAGIATLRDLIEGATLGGAVHRRRHLDRMRNSGFSFARRDLDQDATDPVRRVSCQSGDARRGMAAAVRHGGTFRRRQAGPRASRAGEPLPRRQSSGRRSRRISTICTKPPASQRNMWSSCTATAPMRRVSTVQRGMNCRGSSSNSLRQGAAPPTVRPAAAISRLRRCHSVRPCPSKPCAERRSSRSAATSFWRSVRRWSYGRQPDFP